MLTGPWNSDDVSPVARRIHQILQNGVHALLCCGHGEHACGHCIGIHEGAQLPNASIPLQDLGGFGVHELGDHLHLLRAPRLAQEASQGDNRRQIPGINGEWSLVVRDRLCQNYHTGSVRQGEPFKGVERGGAADVMPHKYPPPKRIHVVRPEVVAQRLSPPLQGLWRQHVHLTSGCRIAVQGLQNVGEVDGAPDHEHDLGAHGLGTQQELPVGLHELGVDAAPCHLQRFPQRA
mmetsp:Transcript_113104/g.359422  ORF Transcript_113104/g.359422 Transcript_113104/m.359422 type:complete len:234 (-) Transcript_113104:1775-2476(-)